VRGCDVHAVAQGRASMLAKLRQGSLNVFHLEAEMFDANLTGSTLSLRATLKNGEVDVVIRQKNTVKPQADLFETEHLLVKGGCLFWICCSNSNVLNPGHDNLLARVLTDRYYQVSIPNLTENLGSQVLFLVSMPVC